MTKAKTQVIDIDNHLNFKEHKGINVADPTDDLDIVNLRTLKKAKDELKYKIGDGIDVVLDEETGKTDILITEADPNIYPAILDTDTNTFLINAQTYSPRALKLDRTSVYVVLQDDMTAEASIKLNNIGHSATFPIYENGEPVKAGLKRGATLQLYYVSLPYSPYAVMSIISCTHNFNGITAEEVDNKILEALGNISEMLDAINREII